MNSKNLTIREMVSEIQGEIIKGELQPERASGLLVKLAALLGNINQEILERDLAYNKVLLFWLENEGKANRAKLHAECTAEYRVKLEARNTKELAVELIRSLKYLLKSAEEEYKAGRYQ